MLPELMMKTVTLKDKSFILSIDADTIQQRIAGLAAQVSEELKGMEPIFIAVLNGSFIFAADLVKKLSIPCEITFVRVASYEGTDSTGVVRNMLGLHENIKDRNVVVIEDIVDRGDTIMFIMEELTKHQPASVKIASLLFKPKALRHDIKVDYVGFEVPNDFLVGYGLDYDGLGRNLNEIYVLKPE